MPDMPIIDEDRCQGCGLCVGVCRCGALVVVGDKVRVVAIDECGWCGLCEMVCPYGAISCPYEIVIENETNQRQ